MFDQLLALVNLGEKMPDAVGWQLVGPYGLSIPEEILEELSEARATLGSHYTCTALIIYNHSGISKSKIKVLYSGNFEFKPKVAYSRRDVPVKWEHDAENKELIFHDIPPDETIEIELFNLYKGFSVNQVLVDGKLITEFMNKRAIAKAYPNPFWVKAMLAGSCLVAAIALAVTAYTGYTAYERNKDYDWLYGVPNGFSSCAPYILDNPPGENSKQILSRKLEKLGGWMELVLKKNKVHTESELYGLDRVFLCTPSNKE